LQWISQFLVYKELAKEKFVKLKIYKFSEVGSEKVENHKAIMAKSNFRIG
jgi:hypothetical protein